MGQRILLSQYTVNIKEAKKTGYDLHVCWEIPDPVHLLFYAH